MVTITQALERVKSDVGQFLSPESIRRLCQDCGHRWRERQLGPVTTIHLFIQQVLHGNTACTHVAHLADGSVTASGYCEARTRLPRAVLERLVGQVAAWSDSTADAADLWRGHRTWLIDGSTFSMPDTPALQAQFGQPGGQRKGCGFPVAHLLALFSARTGMLRETVVAPLRTHDLSQVSQIHPSLRTNDVLVGDRGFCSYVHLALMVRGSHHAVFRLHQRQGANFARDAAREFTDRSRSRVIRRLGKNDQIVEWTKPPKPPTWMTPEEFETLPATLRVRLVRYRIHRPGCRTKEVTLATTLFDRSKYPAAALAALYGVRWEVETNLRHLKTTMKMEVLKCKSVNGVMKEVLVFVLTYNLVRTVMLAAAKRQKVAPKRISFIDALRWLRHAQPSEDLTRLVVNPYRPNRVEPRVLKRRLKPYDLMRSPRAILRQTILQTPLTG
jgi:hypothetical protein